MTEATLDRVGAIDCPPSKFVAVYEAKKPVLIIDGAASWKAVASWGPAYFVELCGEKVVNVSHNTAGVFDYRAGASTGEVLRLKMPFRDAIDFIVSSKGSQYYIQQQEMRTEFKELGRDLEVPYLLSPTRISAVTFWFGGSGSRSPLHYDRYPNLFVQVVGMKEFTLFSPEHGESLYAAVGSKYHHCSRVDVFDPNLADFPLYGEVQARALKVRIMPGNILYIPAGWWHAVESLSMSVSVNYWHWYEEPCSER